MGGKEKQVIMLLEEFHEEKSQFSFSVIAEEEDDAAENDEL